MFRYFSPYPLSESDLDDTGTPSAKGHQSASTTSRIPGVPRTAFHSFDRTSDILAGGLGRTPGAGHNATLWVCDRCFKYMAEGLSWELHLVRLDCSLLRLSELMNARCIRKSVPGEVRLDGKSISVEPT